MSSLQHLSEALIQSLRDNRQISVSEIRRCLAREIRDKRKVSTANIEKHERALIHIARAMTELIDQEESELVFNALKRHLYREIRILKTLHADSHKKDQPKSFEI